jgi:ethanolamine utilization protein EutN
MYIAKVRGTVVCTRKTDKLSGHKLLVIHQVETDTLAYTGRPVIAVDLVGAGIGEMVLVCPGGSARHSKQTDGKPVDCTVVGIVDSIRIGGGTKFEKYPAEL